jgi:hypothetical protein
LGEAGGGDEAWARAVPESAAVHMTSVRRLGRMNDAGFSLTIWTVDQPRLRSRRSYEARVSQI